MRKKILAIVLFLAACLAASAVPAYAETKNFTVRSEASIKAVLELAVSQSADSELRFGNVRSSSTPTEVGPFIIKVDVTSNTGERYQVTQALNGPLQNTSGDKISAENLKFKTSSAKSVGTTVQALEALTVQSQTIYLSDNLGSSDTISIDYMLTAPAFQPPGDYSALLTYTASAL